MRTNSNNQVHLIDPLTDPRWDEFVASHPFGWICHLSGWKTVLEKSFKHMKGYYFVLMDEKGETIKAGLPVYFVDSWLTGKRIVSIPFATICDPLISEKNDFLLLMDEIKTRYQRSNSKYIELTTANSHELINDDCLDKIYAYKCHVLKLQNTLNDIKKSFHPMVARNINKSLKKGIIVRICTDESDIELFYKLYVQTRKNLNLPSHPYCFLKKIMEFILSEKKGYLLLGEKNNKPIVGGIFFAYKERFLYEYAAWDRDYNESRPNYFLLWESIKLAYEEGYKVFDFGRTHYKNKGLMEFKSRWGTDVQNLPKSFFFYESRRDYSKNEESIEFKTIKALCRILPYYPYLLLSKFLYNHHG